MANHAPCSRTHIQGMLDEAMSQQVGRHSAELQAERVPGGRGGLGVQQPVGFEFCGVA